MRPAPARGPIGRPAQSTYDPTISHLSISQNPGGESPFLPSCNTDGVVIYATKLSKKKRKKELANKQMFLRNKSSRKSLEARGTSKHETEMIRIHFYRVRMENPRAFRLLPILDGFEIYEIICKKKSAVRPSCSRAGRSTNNR